MSVDPTIDDADARRIAWADYRKEYGVLGADMSYAHNAFLAGWDAARGALDIGGPLR